MQNFHESLREPDPFNDIIGLKAAKDHLKSAILVQRHVILVGPPGVGKTTLAKNVAKLLPEITVNDCPYHCSPDNPQCPVCLSSKQKTKKISGAERFIRLQGSPDLTAEDLIGDIDPVKAMKYGPTSIEAFTPGKIFKANNGILFFDEINRCPEKLQNALLQVLQEGRATIASYTVDIGANFILIATMNPEDSSTEKLSDVLLDRFDVIYIGYPDTLEDEVKIVKLKAKKIEAVSFPDDLLEKVILFIRRLRQSPDLEKFPSVRASLGLYERATANAWLRKAKHVDFDDVRQAIVSVIAHRIRLKPSLRYVQKITDYLEKRMKEFGEETGLGEGDIP